MSHLLACNFAAKIECLHHSLPENGKTGHTVKLFRAHLSLCFFVIFVVEYQSVAWQVCPDPGIAGFSFFAIIEPFFKDMAYVFMVLEIMHGLKVRDIFLQTSSTNLKMTLFSAALKKI